jgi:hypothetical protein
MEASYCAHPIDEIEPLPQTYTAGAEAFLRILGWMGEARTTTALAMRAEVILHTLAPQLWDSTAASIASRYQVTRAEISKLAVGLRDAFPSANIQAPTQRNERTRQKCKTAQKKIVETGLRKNWPSRISRLNSQPTAS